MEVKLNATEIEKLVNQRAWPGIWSVKNTYNRGIAVHREGKPGTLYFKERISKPGSWYIYATTGVWNRADISCAKAILKLAIEKKDSDIIPINGMKYLLDRSIEKKVRNRYPKKRFQIIKAAKKVRYKATGRNTTEAHLNNFLDELDKQDQQKEIEEEKMKKILKGKGRIQ